MCTSETLQKLRDITEILDELDNLYISTKEREVELLANAVTDMVVILDDDGIITYANPSSSRVLGYDPKELLGTCFAKLSNASKLQVEDVLNKTTELVASKKNGDEQRVIMYVGDLSDPAFHFYIAIIRKMPLYDASQ